MTSCDRMRLRQVDLRSDLDCFPAGGAILFQQLSIAFFNLYQFIATTFPVRTSFPPTGRRSFALRLQAFFCKQVSKKHDSVSFQKACHGNICPRLSASPSRSACFLEKMLSFLENMPLSFLSSPLRLSVPIGVCSRKDFIFSKKHAMEFLSSPLRLSVPIGVFSKKDCMFSRKHAMVISVVASPPLRPDGRVF